MLTPNLDMAADRGGERGRQVSVNQLLIWNRQLAPLPDSQSAAGHGLSRNIPVGKCAPPPPLPTGPSLWMDWAGGRTGEVCVCWVRAGEGMG